MPSGPRRWRARSDVTVPTTAREPDLAVRRSVPWYLRRRFLRSFLPVLSLALVGVVALLESANLRLPFQTLVTFDGSMGAQAHLINDQRVRELLLRHHMRVNVIRRGSVAATLDPDVDFVFTSGQYPAEAIIDQRIAAGQFEAHHRPFVSSLVLATYRDYAETLRAAGVATPQDTPGFDLPFYYNLDMGGFLDLVRAGRSWNDLNSSADVDNDNQVLAQTPDLCDSNTGGTYIGLVSHAVHGRVPSGEDEAAAFGAEIKPLIDAQGLPLIAPEVYFSELGRQYGIIVLYEHQYLAHQLDHRDQKGELDDDRVLLYPDAASQTHPLFVALNEDADRLGKLLVIDPDLRERALGKGFGVLSTGGASGTELSRYLAEHGVPEPSSGNDTRAILPDYLRLNKMIDVVGDCPPAGPQ